MNRFRSVCLFLGAAVIAASFCPEACAQDRNSKILLVIVVDSKDNAVAEAEVSIAEPGSGDKRCAETRPGEYECPETSASSVVRVNAAGFQGFEGPSSNAAGGLLKVVLSPAPFNERVVVSASGMPTEIADTPASIVAIGRRQIETSASSAPDEILRQTAGFSLFRRTDSRTANLTTQGASLRGLNPSGASRTSVLFDGAQLNDPFGGWVPWSSVPGIAIERIEVLKGGASSLYGSDALSGLIDIVPRRARGRSAFSGEAFVGAQGTASMSGFGGFSRESFSLDGFGSFFTTDGYIPVAPKYRGRVDERAGSRNESFSVRFAPKISKLAPFLRVSYFRESRKNGTRLQRNRTHTRRFILGIDPEIGDPIPGTSDSALSVRAFGSLQVYDQTFSAVSGDRSSESLVRLQRVPSRNFGISARFSTAAGRHFLMTGTEWSETSGSSDEQGYFNEDATGRTGSVGSERTVGVYFQDWLAISRVVLIGRVRVDHWRNFKALRADTTASGDESFTVYPDRSETAVSPGLSANIRLNERVYAYAGVSSSFRAPTLNELYRGFRVGNIVTLSNENLKAEKAVGVEGGISIWSEGFSFRAAVFQTRVRDAVSNVTIDPDSTPILRQRLNAAKIRVNGFEAEGAFRAGGFRADVGYLFSGTEYTEFPLSPELVGRTLPQSPKHQLTARALYEFPRENTLGIQLRGAFSQFDDDLNRFILRRYLRVDVFASRKFGRLEVFCSVENIFDSRFDVGVTPVRTVAAPFGARIGVRWN